MNQSEWTELKRIFAEACELGPEERSALLDRRCAGKPRLRAELEEYLRHHAELCNRTRTPEATARGELPGARIGRYRLVERIGEGGFGTVWMAEQEEPLKRMVALKLLKPGMDSRAVLARFDVERQALALMDHPGIARIHDGGATEEGRPYFVMELVRGQPITRYCDEHGSSTAERLTLFREVCLAVQHAHQKGVIHRDLKPSNVLVTEQDGRPQPKVIDFGVAKATGPQLTEKTLATGVDQLIGTPDYMAPEQAAPGGVDIDTRADVYALGVLLYELLTGTRPFDMRALLAQGLEQVLRTLREVEPERPSLRKRALAADLDWLVMRALEKDRSRRYPTVQDFADDIERHLRHEPLSAGPPSATYRLRKFVRRNRTAVAAVGAVVLALLAGTAAAWRGYYLAEERRVQSEQKSTEALRSAESEKEQRTIAVAKEAEARRELARSAFFIKLLFDMLGSADPHAARHAELKVSEMLEKFEADLSARLVQEPEVRADAHLVLAHAWLGIGNSPRVEANLEQAQAALADNPDEDSSIRYLELRAEALHAEQEWERAIEFERQVIARRQALGRPEDLLALPFQREWLGDLLRHSGELVEAEKILQELLSELQAKSPRDERARTELLVDLSKVMIAGGRFAEAEGVLRTELESLPADDIKRPLLGVILTTAIMRQGRIPEAEKLLRALGPAVLERYGQNHPVNSDRLLNLGFACESQGRPAEAEAAFREALAIARATSPAGSAQLVGPLSELGTVIYSQARLEEALPLLQEAFEIRSRKPSLEEPDLARCAGNVSSVLFSLSKFEDALPYCIAEVDARRGKLPGDREDFGLALYMQAEVLRGLKRFAEAEAALRERMALFPSADEDPAPNRCTALMALGGTLVALERWTEAEQSLREAIAMIESRAKPGYWALEDSRSLLGAALVGQGRTSEGGELLRSAAKRIQASGLHRLKKREALERLLRYLETSGQTADATACKAELDEWK